MAVATDSKDLATPDRVVAAITGAVERDTDDGLTEPAVFGQQRCHVRMVVLDQIERTLAGLSLGPTAGLIPGMKIGGQSHRLAANLTELTDRRLERPQRLPGRHVTDMPGHV